MKASAIRTLDELNEAFVAWMEQEYNRRVHSETGQSPEARFREGLPELSYVDDQKLRQAFRWKEQRTADKTGVFSLFGARYQVGPELSRKRFDVYFDPEMLDEVEVHHDGRFVERSRPLQVHQHRRPMPKAVAPASPAPADEKPTVDWLGHLVAKRRDEGFVQPALAASPEPSADDQIVALLKWQLVDEVFDEAIAREFLRRYGPFDPQRAEAALRDVVGDAPAATHHITFYLQAIREALT